MKPFVLFLLLSCTLSLVACQNTLGLSNQLFIYPRVVATDTVAVTPTILPFDPTSTSTTLTDDETYWPTATPIPTATPYLVYQQSPGEHGHPTLADFWDGRAEFVIDRIETGLPRGESDTIVVSNGEMWSYLHASDRAAGVVDQCGDPVAFPGCAIIYKSRDGGHTFHRDPYPVCQIECNQCPCTSQSDQIDQQQYPRVFFNGYRMTMFYEYRAGIVMRHSWDGLNWTRPDAIINTGVWNSVHRNCTWPTRIGAHPFALSGFECLAGGPPGIYVENNHIYLFAGIGQNPGGMGCYVGYLNSRGNQFVPCENYQLFQSASEYGPLYEKGPYANPYFDFRMVSSAEVQRIVRGEEARYYMLYEGIRGPGLYDDGDSQFGLGLARSKTDRIDGPWEKYHDNPILLNLPGNIGLGHADLVVYTGQTLLYTSLEGKHRSRLSLVWK